MRNPLAKSAADRVVEALESDIEKLGDTATLTRVIIHEAGYLSACNAIVPIRDMVEHAYATGAPINLERLRDLVFSPEEVQKLNGANL